ncbi:MAG: hypothetical protein KatS3mg087_1877 [Patescibacteria group bacterium]|nr:MAG: hypothetical protein KatS3mg087_1877 [Patescibacteria group bacterium]
MINIIKFTQEVVGAKVDGIYGKETMTKVKAWLEQQDLLDKVKADTIIAIRTSDTFTDKFDDLMLLQGSAGHVFIVPCSTKAGRYYVDNPITPEGTAVIAEGFYHESHVAEYTYRFGGRHIELKQIGNAVKFYRDDNKDKKIDRTNVKQGYVGLNIHIAKSSIHVGKWSAGCIVVPAEYWTELERHLLHVFRRYSLHVLAKDVKSPYIAEPKTTKERSTKRTQNKKSNDKSS